MKKLFTSESVTKGHPDKLCDYISDSILDGYLELDKNSRVACETVASKGQIFVTGEITSSAKIDIEKIVRETIKSVGYDNELTDIDYRTCKVEINISEQSHDIWLGTNDDVGGAGDQGLMFGFACDETKNYMPLPIHLAHALSKKLTQVREENILKYLRPDGKTQVTVEYENDIPIRVDTVVVSTQHVDTVDLELLRKDIINDVINSVISKEYMDSNTKYYINPTGRFVIGGPLGDSGLTGRKIIVDTYGGYARHGGGAFSGKDPTKVDRSASYMARHIAKNIVANNMAKKCEIQISYAIGIAKPVSIYIDTFGTSNISDKKILGIVNSKFDLSPKGIIDYLSLKNPIYALTTNYGHFGKENLTWEKVIKLV
ncbi:MAG: methionine adenosyltransferase [Clostridia bacterium]|nr:methionine adenosyltransferase [Clostridia bacterium]